MYSEYKKEEPEILQTSGKEKSDNKKSKASLVNMEPAPDEKKSSRRSSRPKLQFKVTKARRQNYFTRSKKL